MPVLKPARRLDDVQQVTPDTSAPESAAHRLAEAAVRQALRFAPASLPAGVGLTASVWHGVDHVRLLGWLLGMEMLIAYQVVVAVLAVRDARPLAFRRARRLVSVGYALQGLAIGTLPFLVPGLDGPARGGVDATYAIFAMGSAAALLLASAEDLLLFTAGLIPLLTSAAAAVLLGATELPRAIALFDVLMLGILLQVRTAQIRKARVAVVAAARAEQLAADLTAERDRSLAANELLAQANAALEHRAGHDLLTGLANREQFVDRLESALAAGRAVGRHTAVLFFDLDRFKIVNDAGGHATGDQLLVQVADRTRALLREGDLMARHGGDEFTVLLPFLSSEREATAVAERVRGVLAEPFHVAGQRIDVSASIGIAVDRSQEDGPADLLRHADAALYRAKDRGRNRVELFDESLRTAISRRLQDETELRVAIEQQRIVPWYQPIVELETGRIVGAEALARWLHDERGLLLPADFLDLALESGLSAELGRCIMAPTLLLRRRLASVVDPSFQLTANVAARSKPFEDVVQAIADAARALDVDPGGITLEITDNALGRDPGRARQAVREARDLGFGIALDDFGTGYGTLSLVRDLPLTAVKADRSFVRGMAVNPADEAVIRAVIDLAGTLGLETIFEGVETGADVSRLLEAGGRLAQGFYYSPAVPAAELEVWLREGPPWPVSASGVGGQGIGQGIGQGRVSTPHAR